MKTLALALILAACGSDEFDVPKPYSGNLPDDPQSCGEIRGQGQASTSQVLVDGAPAECVGEGVTCSIAGLPGFSGACLMGVPIAVCNLQRWTVHCDLDGGNTTPVDGGADG